MAARIPFYLLLVVMLVGCQTTAPIHVWRPAPLGLAGSSKVALAPIDGPSEVAEALQAAFRQSRPIHPGAVALLDPKTLEEATAIRLTSYDGTGSDIGAMNAARLVQADFLLQGTVVHHSLDLQRTVPPEEPPQPWWKRKREDPLERESLSMMWQVIDVKTGKKLKQQTISLTRKEAVDRYPELEWVAGPNQNPVVLASARQSWQLVSPTVQPEEVTLVQPWVTLGASTIRRGNAHAKRGDWAAAEREWQEAADNYPYSKAAWYNLAMAGVAHEDYELAKRRLEHSRSWLKWAPSDPGEVWIERQQQAYHRSFQLPPPEGGWKVPELVPPKSPQEVESTPPQNLDDLPWWTAIPFTKPPGWSWSAWLKHPFHAIW